MRDKLIFIVVFLLTVHPVKAQPDGKRYQAEVGVACKAFTDGCCLLYSYCNLEFKADSVYIYFSQTASCTDKSKEKSYLVEKADLKAYKWEQQINEIVITGFPDYGNLVKQNNQLLGRIRKNKWEELVFTMQD